ncbi:hypothetical protein Cgig2_027867 [Carnegiea gigantea]|uniref:Uncharacterized protein n=1 Tax=Carnegiea gigantea TaxID=171969 RepID=A0A9Q1GK08_9CARY|nr:hypothetical protein Cgig2_027867 [Carnegiea gigantea]
MIPDFEEEVEHVGENIFESRVSITMNPSLINIPDDFKDDKERIMVPLNNLLQPIKKAGSLFNRFLADVAKRPSLCPLNYKDWRLVPQYFRGRIIMFIRGKFLLPDGIQVNQKILKSVGERVRGFKYFLRCKYVKEDTTKEALYNLEKSKRPSAVGDQMWVGLVDYFFSEKFQDKEGSYHEPATKKFVTGASEVVFSKDTVPAETFAYHKLMGPESSGRVRGVGSGVTSNQLIAKRNCQSGTEPSDSSIVSLLLKEVQSLRQEGDDVEENQRNNTSLTGEPIRDTSIPVPTLAKNNEAYIKDADRIENSTVLRDEGGAAHTSRWSHVPNQVSSHSVCA